MVVSGLAKEYSPPFTSKMPFSISGNRLFSSRMVTEAFTGTMNQ